MILSSESEICLENYFPVSVKEFKKISSGYIFDNKYVLKATELSSERILFIHTAINHLRSHGFTNTEKFIETVDGLPFINIDGKNYVLISLYPGTVYTFEDRRELEEAVELMADFHIAGKGYTANKAGSNMEKYNIPFTVKCTLGETPHIFKKRYGELMKYKKRALGSVDAFDRDFSQISGCICAMAQDALARLETSSYNKMVQYFQTNGCLCHRDFTGHNIIKGAHPFLINFDQAAIELPVYDLTTFLRRRMRKCDWSHEEAHFILNTYSKKISISNDDLEIIKILLLFPQKLWRIANKYYNSRRGRYEKTALAKLEEVKQEIDPLLSLVNSL